MPTDDYTVDDKLDRVMRDRVVPASMLDDANKRIAELEAALREARVHLMETFPAGKAEAIAIIDRALAEGRAAMSELQVPGAFAAWVQTLPDAARKRLSIHDLRQIWEPVRWRDAKTEPPEAPCLMRCYTATKHDGMQMRHWVRKRQADADALVDVCKRKGEKAEWLPIPGDTEVNDGG